MASFVIQGGNPLTGVHRAAGNKNAVLPMLAACVLTDEPVRLTNVPLIQDVHTMLAILDELGVNVERKGHTVTLCARGIRRRKLDPKLCRHVRSSILFAGPMAARHGLVSLSAPGGDVIGRRRLDTHVEGLRQLGIGLHTSDGFTFKRKKLTPARILLDEASVTATENVVMAAVLIPGRTTIFNAACEPHVQDLCQMLCKMGAQIGGIGTNYLIIDGVDSLNGTSHRVQPDTVDATSFLAAAAATGGALTIEDLPADQFDVISRPFRKLGLKWKIDGRTLTLPADQRLRVSDDFGAAIPKVEDGIWPAFPSDLMSVVLVMATQARGTMLFFEKLFESRMYFVDRLIAMGARIVQCDPHRVIVSGPAPLHGIHMSSPDIRAGMALLIAALCAKGESVIDNAEIIDRGYEGIETKLRRLGADIVRRK
ncbi:MAG: UDP-N-acetylglucosamine 1-carboxyvinyltransferase [Kiritimatiellia bacterium]|jgi:UDP-N-acetylglucosamine 1-carboxyvinyltransferase|nr:UDP-N-acetylglucosamine 1-carboxyvinyltransferase [Kiritimatiellia bacterium]MDP6629778.1 UDP-N-acetylglucosamine 1-carboxyvinyltransferase [Kiritimatiellia bacterium]MDP6811054.1 UDP-N-acetylglucosamine 1-carboxyvinyltransferase [Kiritimatiellia bacterium]MDP7023091.1 UDP-N-acetylglucosamine 1-carboxyvinyltransferase [Kiritimatiellia bacterium]